MMTFLLGVVITYLTNAGTPAPFPQSGTARFGTVHTIICVSTVLSWEGYLNNRSVSSCSLALFVGVPSTLIWYKVVSRGWSYTQCNPVTASRQKAVFKCCFRTVITSLSFIYFLGENDKI